MMDDLLSQCFDGGLPFPSKPVQEASRQKQRRINRRRHHQIHRQAQAHPDQLPTVRRHPHRHHHRPRHSVMLLRLPHHRHETYYYQQQVMRMILTMIFAVICTILTASSSQYVVVVDAFASNLVVTTIGCMTDLSTDEIIMNNEVKLPTESDYPKMHLVVLDDDDNHLESPFKYHSSPESSPTELKLAFVNPYKDTDEGRDLGDIQFVMEIGVVGGNGDANEDEDPPSPASFIYGGAIGCDGNKRVSASLRDYDGHVKLKINDPTSNIRVWAGWATGQESVRLVPDLILEPASDDGTEESDRKGAESGKEDIATSNDEEESRRREGSKKADAKQTKPKKNPLSTNDVHPELKKTAADVRQKIGDIENANGHDRGSRARGGGAVGGGMKQNLPGQDQNLDLASSSTSSDRRPHHHNSDINNEEKPTIQRKDLKTLQEEERQRRRDLEAQMRKNFLRADNASDLDMLSYGIGCGFFIVSMGIIILVFGKKSDNKGRRDL